jgi:predicted ATP-grasp superfamily ATP-dependent carboligase
MLKDDIEQEDYVDAIAWIATALSNKRLLFALRDKYNPNCEMLGSKFNLIMLATFLGDTETVKLILNSRIRVNTKISPNHFSIKHIFDYPNSEVRNYINDWCGNRIYFDNMVDEVNKDFAQDLMANTNASQRFINGHEVSVSSLTNNIEIINLIRTYDAPQARIANHDDEKVDDIPSNEVQIVNKIDVLKNMFNEFSTQFSSFRDSMNNLQHSNRNRRRDNDDEKKELSDNQSSRNRFHR